MKFTFLIFTVLASFNAFAATDFYASTRELRAILDVPNLAALLNDRPIVKVEKVNVAENIFVVDAGFCQARVKVTNDPTGVNSPRAEALGAVCGP